MHSARRLEQLPLLKLSLHDGSLLSQHGHFGLQVSDLALTLEQLSALLVSLSRDGFELRSQDALQLLVLVLHGLDPLACVLFSELNLGREHFLLRFLLLERRLKSSQSLRHLLRDDRLAGLTLLVA